METPDIASLSNYPRVEDERISARHGATFIALQFWQAMLILVFGISNTAFLVTFFRDPQAKPQMWLSCAGCFGLFVAFFAIKSVSDFASAVGWSRSKKVGMILLELTFIFGCGIGLIGPWLVQFFAAKTIKGISVSVVWPFISSKAVHRVMELPAES